MSSLLRRMREKDGFSDTERAIAAYLLDNYRELSVMSTRELARRTYTSSAAIVRFSQKMGFEGYPEFKVKFLAEMLQSRSGPKERFITGRETVPEVMEKVLLMGSNALQETHEGLDQADVNRALHHLRHAGHIGFYAMGDNMNLARIAASNFIMVGKYVSVHDSLSLQFLEAYAPPKEHVGMILSRTGENHLLKKIAGRLSDNGNPVICITAAPKSTLAGLASTVPTWYAVWLAPCSWPIPWTIRHFWMPAVS